jgi:hypothetical protein
MRRFAKPLYGLTPVPRVRIPPSPPVFLFSCTCSLMIPTLSPRGIFSRLPRIRQGLQPKRFPPGCKSKLDFLYGLKVIAERAKLDEDKFWLHKSPATFATPCLWAPHFTLSDEEPVQPGVFRPTPPPKRGTDCSRVHLLRQRC